MVLLVLKAGTRLVKWIMVLATLAACFFLIAIFSMTKLLMMTTEGYPEEVSNADLATPALIGAIAYYLGIFGLISVISLSGWTKSKKMGLFTTTLAILTISFILFLSG